MRFVAHAPASAATAVLASRSRQKSKKKRETERRRHAETGNASDALFSPLRVLVHGHDEAGAGIEPIEAAGGEDREAERDELEQTREPRRVPEREAGVTASEGRLLCEGVE